MFKISVETSEKTGIDTIIVIKKDNKSILWIKMHDVEEILVVKNMSDLTVKAIKGTYNTETHTKEQIKKYKRYGKEIMADLAGIYICEDLPLSITMDCKSPTAVEFRAKLGFNQYDIMIAKEHSVLTKIMK